MTTQSGSFVNINMRSDGKRLFIEIETNEIDQYNLVRESISQYLDKETMGSGIQSYSVKDLGTIYITINDTVPYNPIKKTMICRLWATNILLLMISPEVRKVWKSERKCN